MGGADLRSWLNVLFIKKINAMKLTYGVSYMKEAIRFIVAILQQYMSFVVSFLCYKLTYIVP